jgi:hypothetical protein
MGHKGLIISFTLVAFILLIVGCTKILEQNINNTASVKNSSEFRCEDKIFTGKGYFICGYGITNPEIIPQDISYENPDRFSRSIKAYRVTGRIWEEQLAPCPETDDPRSMPQQCDTVNKYIEIKSIEVIK